MKVLGILSLCIFSACSAASDSSGRPSEPKQAVLSGDKCSSSSPESIPVAPEPTRCVVEKKSIEIPGPPGFWCSDFRTKPDDSAYLSPCYRVRLTCESARKNADKFGASASPCQVRQNAHCFLITHAAEQAIFWRCYSSEKQCLSWHERLQEKHVGLPFSSCLLTAFAPIAGHERRYLARSR